MDYKYKEFFPHFIYASNDSKIEQLINNFGIEGYGTFFLLLEKLSQKKNKILTFSELNDILKLYHINDKVINYLFEIKLLIKKRNYLYSKTLKEHFEKVDNICNINKNNRLNKKKRENKESVENNVENNVENSQNLEVVRPTLEVVRPHLEAFRPDYMQNNTTNAKNITNEKSGSYDDYEKKLIFTKNPKNDVRTIKKSLDPIKKSLEVVSCEKSTSYKLRNGQSRQENKIKRNIDYKSDYNNMTNLNLKNRQKFNEFILKLIDKFLIEQNIEISNNFNLYNLIDDKFIKFQNYYENIHNKKSYIYGIAKDIISNIQEYNYKKNSELQKQPIKIDNSKIPKLTRESYEKMYNELANKELPQIINDLTNKFKTKEE